MNKAKAVFAAVIITAVAGTSALLLHFNENGTLDFNDDKSVLTTVVTTNGNSSNNNHGAAKENITEEKNENTAPDVTISTTDVNEFLTVFSKVYFSENSEYIMEKPDNYELIRFAYSYAMMNNRTVINTEYIDDEIGYYNKINANYVNDILKKYFKASVRPESVFTEKTYAFFKYENGHFYTPAADGISYINVSIVDNMSQNDNLVTVDFSVYSSGVTTDMTSQQARRASGDRYATGTARFYVENDNFILKYYKINK